MELILCADIPKLGKIGDVVEVRNGYARNFLIPQKKAYLATPGNLKKIELEKQKRESVELKVKEEAQVLADKLSGISVTVSVEVNDLEKLYGSVTEIEIAKALEQEGHSIDKKDILIEKPLEELGIYEVNVRVHPQVSAQVRVWVTKK